MGNIDSIVRAVEECNGIPIVSNKASDFEEASNIILPGVGSFHIAMQNISRYNLDSILRKHVLEKKKPLLGICLGMQILATRGFEGRETPGLNFIKGEVKLFERDEPTTRIPHIGWNNVYFKKNSLLLII